MENAVVEFADETNVIDTLIPKMGRIIVEAESRVVVERLQRTRARMDRIKRSEEPIITFGVQRGISAAPRPVSTALTDFFANKAVGVLTNVPGPRAPLTFAGVGVRQVIGFAPSSGDQPMTCTVFSYAGTVTVGGEDITYVPTPKRNFGMAYPEGYRKAMRVMELADQHRFPLVTLVDDGTMSREWGAIGIDDVAVTAVPEPTTYGLMGLGVAVIPMADDDLQRLPPATCLPFGEPQLTRRVVLLCLSMY